jgi:hypothetical protein
MLMETIEAVLNHLIKSLAGMSATLFDTWPVAVMIGIALCFFGFKIFRFSLFIFGCTIGALIGLGLGDLMVKPWGGIAGAIALGVLGGYGFLLIARIAGLVVGMVLGGMVSAFILGESLWIIPVTLASGLGAFLFLTYFVMASTSCWGAFLAIGGISRLLEIPLNEHHYLAAASGIVLFTLGMGYQVIFHLRRS